MAEKELKNLYGFPEMYKVIPEGQSGKWSIQHQVATEEKAEFKRRMGVIKGDWTWHGFEAGTYCVLTNANGFSGEIVMSDTWLERFTNQEILKEAKGDVLLAGLGIGLVITGIISKVNSLTVVEIEPDVITLVESPLRDWLSDKGSRLVIVNADIFTYEPIQQFDTIYFDIWQGIYGNNYRGAKTLHNRFRRYLMQGGYMNSWQRGEFRRLHKKEK